MDLLEQKLNILTKDFEGAKRGLEFINEFSINLKILEQKSNKEGSNVNLCVWDNTIKSKVNLVVDPYEFQKKLQEFYMVFVRKKFLKKFEWYNKLLYNIDDFVKYKFKLDSTFSEYFHEAITNCFLIHSRGANFYDYDVFCNCLTDYFNKIIGLNLNDSNEIVGDLLNNLMAENLIIVKRNIFHRIQSFCISDKYFDIILYNTSLFLPNIYYFDSTSTISYNSNYGIENLQKVILSFFHFYDCKENFSLGKYLSSLKYPQVIEKLNNFKDLNIKIPDDTDNENVFFYLYFLNTLLNEYCFQILIMGLFEKYYYSIGKKNILFSSKIIEFHLYQ